MHTIGLSPKLIPSVIGLIVGLVLVIVGERDVGLAIIGTSTGTLGLGYAAPPGVVVAPELEVDVASDDLLGDPSPPAR